MAQRKLTEKQKKLKEQKEAQRLSGKINAGVTTSLNAIPGLGPAASAAHSAASKAGSAISGGDYTVDEENNFGDRFKTSLGSTLNPVGSYTHSMKEHGALEGAARNTLNMVSFGAVDTNKVFQQGGNMSGQVDKFNAGRSHEQGGIPIPGHGAEVEQGETKVDDYVFSDSLKVTKSLAKDHGIPEKYVGKTFSEVSEKLEEKYSGKRENDLYSNNAKKRELQRLKDAQEKKRLKQQEDAQKRIQELDGNNFKRGGDLDEYENGGEYQNGGSMNAFPSIYNNEGFDKFHPAGMAPGTGEEVDPLSNDANIEVNSPVPDPNQDFNPKNYDDRKVNSLESEINTALGNNEGSGRSYNDSLKTAEKIAPFLQPAAALAMTAGKEPDNKFPRADFDEVDYSRARDIAEREAARTRARAEENIRQNANTAGQALQGNIQSDVSTFGSLSDLLNKSLQQEENMNAKIRNREERINQRTGLKEEIADQKDEARREDMVLRATGQAGNALKGVMKDERAFSAQNQKLNDQISLMKRMFPNATIRTNENGELVFNYRGTAEE